MIFSGGRRGGSSRSNRRLAPSLIQRRRPNFVSVRTRDSGRSLPRLSLRHSSDNSIFVTGSPNREFFRKKLKINQSKNDSIKKELEKDDENNTNGNLKEDSEISFSIPNTNINTIPHEFKENIETDFSEQFIFQNENWNSSQHLRFPDTKTKATIRNGLKKRVQKVRENIQLIPHTQSRSVPVPTHPLNKMRNVTVDLRDVSIKLNEDADQRATSNLPHLHSTSPTREESRFGPFSNGNDPYVTVLIIL